MSFAEAGRAVVEGAAAGLYQAGSVLMATSQQLVPVETGTLKRSGRVEEPVETADSVSVTVGYGYGGEVEARGGGDGHSYGFWVEVREFTAQGKRVYHKPPTQAHYLEDPAKALAPNLGNFVQEGIRARLEGR